MSEPTTLQAAERLLATLGAGRAAVLRLAAGHLAFSGLVAVSSAVNDEALRIGEAQRLLDRRVDVLRARLGRPPIERTEDDVTPRDANTVSPVVASTSAEAAAAVASPSRLQRHVTMGRAREVAAVAPPRRSSERRALAAAPTLAPAPDVELPLGAADVPASGFALPPADAVLSVAAAADDAELPDLGDLLDEDDAESQIPVSCSPPRAPQERADATSAGEPSPPADSARVADSVPPPVPASARAAASPRLVAAVSAVSAGHDDEEAQAMTPDALATDGADEDALLGVGVAAPGGGIRLGGVGSARGRRARAQEESAPRLTDEADEAPSITQSQVPSIRPAGDDGRVAQLMDDAVAAAGRGELQKSIQWFTDVLDLRHDRSDASIGRGRCFLELGDYSSAMSDFQRAEDLHPDRPDPHVAMGDLYFARKEYRRAIEFYDQAVELDGSHAMARCRRGISYYYRKNYRQAFQDLQRAYSLDPEIPNIRKYVQMAVKKMERGD
ncbi:MAG: tetratricopeptide repeat protein [Myxococcales bacterium]|nr:tetratricopeptide repeat protein [Myxococcales bacterium]